MKQSLELPIAQSQPPRKQQFHWPTFVFCTTLCFLLFLYLDSTSPLLPSFDSADHAITAKEILQRHPLIDGHNDLLILLRYAYPKGIYDEDFKSGFEKGGLLGHVDIPRMHRGQLGGAFWSAFVPCPEDGFNFSDANYAVSVKTTLEQLDLYNRLSTVYPEQFTLSRNAEEAKAAFKDGDLISPLAIEGLHQIGNSLATLRLYHQLGVRYATLNWNCHNKYSDAALVGIDGKTYASKPYWNGVSKAGQDLVLEMNRLGMLVDLSHTSVDTMRDVLGGNPSKWNGSIAAPIFSHSSAYSICPHPRNVPDDILQLVKARNSIVMINFSPEFVSCKPGNSTTGLPDFVEETNTIDQVVKHIKYVGELIGYDHVGIGTDYDGIPSTPRGLEDVTKFPDLVDKLLAAGVKKKDVVKVMGKNILRVWSEADRVAKRLQLVMDPVDD